MKRKRVRLDEAFEFVRRRRSIISPNFSFMGQLLQFESQVLATSCAAEAAATASPLLGPKSTTATTSTTATPTSPFIFNFPVSVVNPAYLHHSPITTSPGCWWTADYGLFRCTRWAQTGLPLAGRAVSLSDNCSMNMLPGRRGEKRHGAWLEKKDFLKFTTQATLLPVSQDAFSSWPKMNWLSKLVSVTMFSWTVGLMSTRDTLSSNRGTKLTQWGLRSSKTLLLSLPHTHTHIHDYQLNKLSMKTACCHGDEVFRRGDGHRKEGGIISTRSFLFGCPSCCQTKDGWKKLGRRRWQKAGASSVTGALLGIRPELPVLDTSSSFLRLSFSSLYIPTLLLILSSLPLIFSLPEPCPSSLLLPPCLL